MRCPVCKAENSQGPQCRRCKADLSLLLELEEQRQRMLVETQHCLRRGEWQTAQQYAQTINWLHRNEDSLQLAAVAHLLNRDFVSAWHCYKSWRANKRSE